MMAVVELSDEQRSSLRSVLRGEGYSGSVSDRAQMVLWHDEGYSVAAVAAMSGASKPTVYRWLSRFENFGVVGLTDRKSTGRPREVPESVRGRIVALTRCSPPEETGLSHWSSRAMARYLRKQEGVVVSHVFITQVWRENDLQPHRQGTFKLSHDPDFAEKVIDVVGLYLDPPAGAVVLSVDEKTQVQALDRTQPLLPIAFGAAEQRTHDYVRHGTTNLFAALNTRTGEVIGSCRPKRRTPDFLAFMNEVVSRHPDRELHVVLDNLSTHSGKTVDKWLAKHPGVTLHYTPVGSSWLNQVEIWFGILTRQTIRRGTFGSVRILIDTISAYIADWNEDAAPFTWTATPEEIITKVRLLHRDFKRLLANNLK
jgi:transposase